MDMRELMDRRYKRWKDEDGHLVVDFVDSSRLNCFDMFRPPSCPQGLYDPMSR